MYYARIRNMLMEQSSMLIELLKLQKNIPLNDITITANLNKSRLVFNGLSILFIKRSLLDWLSTVNGVGNIHRWHYHFKIQSIRVN